MGRQRTRKKKDWVGWGSAEKGTLKLATPNHKKYTPPPYPSNHQHPTPTNSIFIELLYRFTTMYPNKACDFLTLQQINPKTSTKLSHLHPHAHMYTHVRACIRERKARFEKPNRYPLSVFEKLMRGLKEASKRCRTIPKDK